MEKNSPFAIVPIEVFMDDRLSKTELRVLGAILSYRDKATNLCWPSRKQIAERCCLPLCKVSTATTSLVSLGWLIKQGNGGKSMHCKYSLTIPNIQFKKVTDSVTTQTVTNLVTFPLLTVTDSVTQTVTDSVTQTVTDSVTQTVTDLGRGKKQTIEQTREREVVQYQETLSPSISWQRRKTDRFGSEYQSDTQQKTKFPVGNFHVTPDMLEFARNLGLSDDYIFSETETLRDKALSGGWVSEDWPAFWRNWMKKAKAFLEKQGASR